jgi:amino acid adenylation domain-containing protein
MKLNTLNFLSQEKYHKIVHEWNRTETDYPADKTLAELFEEQVERTPDHIAVVCEGKCLSYRELNERANRVARYLAREHGIGPDSLVALCLDRSELMPEAILGVLKAGGAYVPISPEYPDERIRYLLEDTKTKAVLTNEIYGERIRALAKSDVGIETLDGEAFRGRIGGESGANPERRAGPGNLAYVIYTSGTTGQPKGVMVEQRSVINLLTALYKSYGFIPSKEVMLLAANYIFDASVEQLFFPLLNGDVLLVVKNTFWREEGIINYLRKEKVTYIHMTPSLLRQIDVEDLPSLRLVNSGGEVLPAELFNRLRGKHFSLVNSYGPTEITVTATVNLEEKSNHIGKPIGNTTCYILDGRMKPLPIGAAGELCIGGAGVARGYLNKPELTAEKFVRNPFQTGEEEARGYNGTLYKTGDLARYLPDGNIECLGRNDFQVKVRGFRIELGEIESALLGYGGIKQAVVTVKERGGERYLAAYYVGEADEDALRAYLEGKLPEYMAPDAYKRLEELPLTVSGKLDRRALPDVEIGGGEEYEEPRDPAEEKIRRVFAEALGLEEGAVSVTGDFFRLGGNSLMAIKLSNKLQRNLGLGIRVADIFTHKTIRRLAEQFDGRGQERPRMKKAVFDHVEEQKLSFAQGRLWFIEKYEGGSNVYNVPMAGKLTAGAVVESAKQAIEEIVRRHEVLRSVIRTDENGEGYQEAIDVKKQPFRVEEYKFENRDKLEEKLKREINHVFRLEEEYPIRAGIYEAEGERRFCVVAHHIAFDGWSQDIFLNEFAELYRYYEEGGAYPLEEVDLQYKDYALWQRNYLTGEALGEQIRYWKDRLTGYETLNLATDKERPQRICYEGDNVYFDLDDRLFLQIRRLAKELGVSVYTVLLSAYYLLLSIYSNQKDIVVGTVAANREYPEISGTIGFFANTLPMRQKINREQDVREFIREVGERNAEAQRHQELPFERLVDELGVEKDESRHPVFQVAFSMQDSPQAENGSDGILENSAGLEKWHRVAKFDLQMSLAESGRRIRGALNYAVSLFGRETIEGYVRSYQEIALQIAEGKGKRIKEISALNKEEHNRILCEWNRTEHEYPADKTVVELFEEQAERTPDNIAVAYEGKLLSYRELNERANRVERYLAKKHGIKSGDLIALCLDRSELMPAMMLAALKAGGAYVPVSPEYPDERVRYLLADTGAKVILTNERYRGKLRALACSGTGIESIDGEGFWEQANREEPGNPGRRSGPEDLAYVIYTSGTTGEPKGVMLEHRGLVNLALNQGNLFGLCDQDHQVNCLWYANYVFDAHVSEVFTALVRGHRLYITSDKQRMDLGLLKRYIQENEINIGTIPPALLDREMVLPLDTIVMAGEVSRWDVMDAYTERGALVINAYGPTESTVCATCHVYKRGDGNRNIGRPIGNTAAYILDEGMKPVPVGAIGELHIGGVGVARGYLNKPELAAEKFVKNPFQSEAEKERGYNGRLYKTGDLARYLGDGNIEYLGRNDFQVKVRGFRIELGEIENALLKHPGVRQSVVIAAERGGEKYLAAYYVGEGELEEEELRAYLEGKLPEYMVPNAWRRLEELPLSANGKLDRRALPEIEPRGTGAYEEPVNERERELAKVFAEVLGLEEGTVSATGDFFRLGGDSIKSIQLASRARRRLGIEVTVKEVFALRTARRIAAKAGSGPAGRGAATEQGRLRGEAGLLPIQGWFFERLAAGELGKPGHFNQAARIETGKLDEGLLEMSARKLAEQHDAFRLRYRKDGEGKVVQYYEAGAHEGALQAADIRGKSEGAVEELLTGWQSEFDVWGDSLHTIGYLSGEGERGEVYLAMHHLLVDGVSWRIIKEDLERLYRHLAEQAEEGKSREELEGIPVEEILGRKGTSYRQWAARVKEYGERVSEDEREYWAEETKGIGAHNAALEGWQEETYGEREIELSQEATEKLLRAANQAYHTETKDILLGSLSLALWALTGKEENYAMVEGHGREELEGTDITRTVGWFTTMWPMRLEAVPGDIVATIIRAKEGQRRLPGNGFGYGAVYGYDGEPPKTVFNYLGQFEGGEVGWGFSAGGAGRTIGAENRDDKLLSVNGAVRGGVLRLSIGGHLGAAALERFAEGFRGYLEAGIGKLSAMGRSYLTPSDTGWLLSRGQLDRLQKERELEWAGKANSLQEGFIYQHLRDGEAEDAYIVQSVWNYREAIEAGKMREAWELAQKRYPALRLKFDWEEELLQLIDREAELDWRYVDISGDGEQEAYIEGLREQDRKEGYDLTKGRLFRIYLLRRGEEYYTTIYSAHHAILDGWSMPILIGFTHGAYAQLRAGERPDEEEDRSYIEAQELQRGEEGEGREYWEEELGRQEEEEDLSGLLKGSRRGERISEYRRIEEPGEAGIEIGGKAYEGIQRYSREQGITMSALTQYAWHRELRAYGRSAATVTGMTVSGRELAVEGIESSVGLYINTLPVVYEHRDGLVVEGLRRLQERINEASARSQTRLGDLGEGARRFSSLFVYENYPMPDGAIGGVEIEYVKGVEKLDYPLGVVAHERDGSLAIGIKYAGELFEREMIQGLLEGMRRTLEQISGGGKERESDLGYLGEGEYRRIVYEWNRNERAYPGEKTVGELFEEQAEKTPGNIVVVYEGKRLSYRELNEQANRMAGYLRKEHGIGPDGLVALCLDRNEQMVAGILGVVKAGGAYVPISPEYPDERIGYMLGDAGAKVVLTNGKYEGRLRRLAGKGSRVESVDSDAFNEVLARESSANPERRAGPENLVYVMYTSGTTGEPKGVLTPHRGVVRLVKGCNYISIAPGDAFLNLSTYAFDGSTFDFFAPLLNGARVVIPRDEDVLNLPLLADFIEEQKITKFWITASLFNVLAEMDGITWTTVKTVIFGGEQGSMQHIREFHRRHPEITLINGYGPTETTTFATTMDMTDCENIPSAFIGKPIAQTSCYILDTVMMPLPVGAAGELYIGGAGVARGYLNKPEQTREKFVPNPFQTEEEKKRGYNGILYKTGDSARYLPDGNIEYLGRNDSQVKIHGFRIELGEIENALLKFPGIKQCVAMAKERGSDKYLAAWYVSNGAIDEEKLKSFLEKKLPKYMTPDVFMRLEKLPVTVNGKLDHRALPDPELKRDEAYEKPRNEAEEKLRELYAEILGLPKETVSVQADFFRIGGDSIRGIRLANRIQRRLHFPITITDILKFKTIRRLCENAVFGVKATEPIRNEQGKLSGSFPLLPSQQYLFDMMDTHKAPLEYYNNYVSTYLVEIENADKDVLVQSLAMLGEYHDAFHLQYEKIGGAYIQRYSDALPEIKFHSLAENFDAWEMEVKQVVTAWVKPINIISGKLAVFGVVSGFEDKRVQVYFLCHHLNTDGVSWRIVGDDLKAIYSHLTQRKEQMNKMQAEEILGPKGTSLRQWSRALLAYKEQVEDEKPYWEDIERAAIVSNRGVAALSSGTMRTRQFDIDEELTGKILSASRRGLETRIDDILLSSLDMALYKMTGMENHCVMMESHGRHEMPGKLDVSRTMGWFALPYPVKLPRPGADPGKTIKRVKETLRKIPGGGIGYRLLCEGDRDQYMPNIYVNYQGEFENRIDVDIDLPIVDEIFQYEMELIGHILKRRLRFMFVSKLSDDKVSGFIRDFEDSLHIVVAISGA